MKIPESKDIKCTAKPMPYKMFREDREEIEKESKEVLKALPKSIDIDNPCLHLDLAEWQDHLQWCCCLKDGSTI